MKIKLFIFGLSLLSIAAHAQYNYNQWGIGVSGGIENSLSDVKQNNNNRCFSAGLYYNYSPYLPIALELQTGKFSGGDSDLDPYRRYFTNNYFAFNIHFDLQLGEIIDYGDNWILNRIKGMYVGLGGGFIFNRISDNRRVAANDPTYIFPGSDNSINGWVPLRFGYEFKLYNDYDEPYATIFLNYSHYLTFGEGLDGYNDPSTNFKNNSQDMARMLTIGVKVNFGNANSYIKPIRGN